MDKLLRLKINIMRTYEGKEKILKHVIRFVVVLAAMIVITVSMGYNTTLSNPVVIIIISLICAFLTMNLNVLVLLAVLFGHMYSLSLEIALVMLAMMIIMYFIYFTFTPKYAYVLVLTPLLFFIKIPFVIPLVLGLTAIPAAIVPTIFGIAIYYIINYTLENVSSLNSVDTDVDQVMLAVQAVFSNKECLLFMATFAVVIVVVYNIKKMAINNAHAVAILIGIVVNLVALLIGLALIGSADVSGIVFLVVGSVISLIIAYILQYVILPLDYSKTVKTQFEDEEYYYYVKAVPKHIVTEEEVSIKRINRRK